mgnify:CR=1 FL=1
MWIFVQIWIFIQNLDFCPKFGFLSKILILVQNLDFCTQFRICPRFRFMSKISIFFQNFDFCPKFRFLSKISIGLNAWADYLYRLCKLKVTRGEFWRSNIYIRGLLKKRFQMNIRVEYFDQYEIIHLFSNFGKCQCYGRRNSDAKQKCEIENFSSN